MKPDQQADLGPAAWLSMFAGFASGVGAFGGISGIPLNVISSGFYIGASLLGSTNLKDPGYTTFADLSLDFGNMLTVAKDAAAAYFESTISALPPNGDVGQGTVLSNLMKSGAFADEYFATDYSIDHVLLRKILKAPIVSEIWNSQRLFIVKFPPKKFTITWESPDRTLYWDPCYGVNDVDEDDFLMSRVYCPHGEADLGEFNYLVVSSILLLVSGARLIHLSNSCPGIPTGATCITTTALTKKILRSLT
jgi:hypothetical protein